mgnify:FL=1
MTARFEQRLMAPGSFAIDLDRTETGRILAPESVVALTASAFAAVIVMPGRVINPAKRSLADLYADAAYVGIHQGRPNRRGGFAGYGPAQLLRLARQATEQQLSKRPLYHGSNTSAVRNNVLRVGVGENQGLEAGPITVANGAATPTKGGKIPAGQEPLETLADTCRRYGKEWDIVGGNKLEVAEASELFTLTPTCVATPKADGDDLNLKGLVGVSFDVREDWDDYATEVAVPFVPPDYEFGVAYEVGDTVVATSGIYYECTTAHTSSGANLPPGSKWAAVDPYGIDTLGSVPYTNPFDGADIVARRVVTARNATTKDDADDIAAAQLARYDQVQRSVTLDTRTFNLSGKVRPGDNVYAFSREHDLYDLTAQVMWRGRPRPLVTVRAQAVETSVDSAMSVLVSTSGSDVVDITRWVAFEDRGQRVMLGSPKRRRRGGSGGGSGALVSPGFAGSV